MSLGTRLFTLLRGIAVGVDETGNRYYEEKPDGHGGRRRKRWVLYAGAAEASKVPPDWHAWLHYTVAEPPSRAPLPAQPWEKEHRPNLTGTDEAYLPTGHLLAGARRPKADGDYEPWRP
ncbi:MAG: NADH:ubiquinone oxidoreductase subunit NDUFA12 [Alphaproteobacteria bacterium]